MQTIIVTQHLLSEADINRIVAAFQAQQKLIDMDISRIITTHNSQVEALNAKEEAEKKAAQKPPKKPGAKNARKIRTR